MALRNASGPGRRASPQHRRIVKLDKKTHADVIAIIENLRDEQWRTLTNGVNDVTRSDFAKVCVGIVQSLTQTTYKMCRPMTVQTPVKVIAQHPKSSATAASWAAAPSLESPQSNAIIAEIVDEVKRALSSALDSSALEKAYPSDSTGGWGALFLRLEEEVSSALMARLDSSDFFARHIESSCSPTTEGAHVDSKVNDVAADPVVTSAKEATESSSQQPEDTEDTDGVTEPLASLEEHEVTTACTNNVICGIYDTYQTAQLEEERRLQAARARESEVSIATAHFVDSVMMELKELASAGTTSAFQWVPKNVCLPTVMASVTADQQAFSPQFQIAAQQKVSEVLSLSKSMTREAPSGSATSVAKDIVGTLVRNLSELSHSDDNSPDSNIDSSVSVQSTYESVQAKVMDFLWSKRLQEQYSDLRCSEDSSEELTRSKNEIVEAQSSFTERESSREKVMRRVGKLVCCLSPPETPAHTQYEGAEGTSGLTEARSSSAQNLFELDMSDIMMITDNEKTLAKSASWHSHGIEESKDRESKIKHWSVEVSSQSPTASEKSFLLEAQSSPTEAKNSRSRVGRLLCCLSTPETPAHTQNGGAEGTSGVTEAGTSARHDLSDSEDVSDIRIIVDNEET
ncbi:hypothetical protein ACEWY4_019607 [Coilia grayii]|uniref:Uncharacterized protein n=1 Tax=Coilia grayii TaxID=363190 RepID=A0ABD1JAJ5_9TELE